jgi:serine/threonine-protein kinase
MQAGTRLGHYEILSAIGKGGMGEVWKARDTKLRRDVAIKTLPPEFAQDADRLARLEREARSLAAVNHPNIASIYGFEEHAGTRYLVLEFVEGETLAERLRQGPIRLEHALQIALSIAEALEAAHERGVIHRDLKPANIKVTPDERVKVLDFGLAKKLPQVGDAPVQTTLHTEVGALLGTAPYMSPEQARGEAVGRQADIWAFGVVLYEMLTGASPFERPTTAETLARVLATDPNLAALPRDTPDGVRHLIRRCLEKDPKRRLQHSGDARIEIEDALAALGEEPTPDARPGMVPEGRRLVATALATAVVTALAGFGVWTLLDHPPSSGAPGVVRLAIPGLEPPGFSPGGAQSVAISSDGSRVAYTGASRLLIRGLNDPEGIRIDAAGADPFFSPDGEWVGFFSSGWKKVPSNGGTPALVAFTTERPIGATWGTNGTIVFATTAGLYEVAADGGKARLLVAPDRKRKELLYAWPHFLPDGRSVLFTIMPEGDEAPQIAWLDLQTGATGVVLTGGTSARYVPTGHLVYAAGQALMAVPFDPAARTTQGAPVTLRDVAVATAPNGAADFAVAAAGTLIYAAPRDGSPPSAVVWRDRDGNEEPLALEPGPYIYPRVSPDGTRIALDVNFTNRDIWIFDLERASLARLTDGPTEDMTPIWAPDSRRVFFASNRTGNFDVYSQAADGSGEARVELASPVMHAPTAFTPDGLRVVVAEDFQDINVLNLTNGEVTPLLQREADDWLTDVSPDGNWIAHESDESGAQMEIYLRPFPDVRARREKVSIDGGRYPRWGPAGSGELYYVALDGSMMAVPVELEPGLRVGRPTKLFDTGRPPPNITGRPYDVAPDGRFIFAKPVAAFSAVPVNVSVILNWFEELREQVPRP